MKINGILTLNANNNYGNRLQNYALQEYLKKYNKCKTIWIINNKRMFIKDMIKSKFFLMRKYKRLSNFTLFTQKFIKPKYILSSKRISNRYDKFIVGSDQVWNWSFPEFNNNMFLDFSNYVNNISYSASFGISYVSNEYKENFKKGLNNIKYISVREDRGKEIVEELTGRKDVEVLVDPTMLLTPEEWDKVFNRPKQLDNIKEEKYILNYFLGELSDSRRKEIERVANENNCHIINILDKNDPFYTCGPSEFLYLEKHAFLICTDSFHSSVFAILYNRPFIIFDREQKGIENMNSRIETLINKFQLKNRKYNGNNITKENLEHDYSEAYKILEKEREKSKDFLEKALDIK